MKKTMNAKKKKAAQEDYHLKSDPALVKALTGLIVCFGTPRSTYETNRSE